MEYLKYHVALSIVGSQPISLIIWEGTSYPFMGNPLEWVMDVPDPDNHICDRYPNFYFPMCDIVFQDYEIFRFLSICSSNKFW